MKTYLTAVLTVAILGGLAGGTISAVTPGGGWSVLESTVIAFWICFGVTGFCLLPMLMEW